MVVMRLTGWEIVSKDWLTRSAKSQGPAQRSVRNLESVSYDRYFHCPILSLGALDN